MGATNSRKMKVFVSNELTTNGGNTVTTITNDDVVLFDRSLTELADTATITANANADVLYVALGNSTVGSPTIETIQTRNIRKVTIAKYDAPVQRKVVLDGAKFDLKANTDYSISLEFQDTGRVAQDKPTRQFYVFTSGSVAPTATEVVDGLVAKINAAKLSYVTASNVSDDLSIVAKAIPANSINTYQFVNFSLAMRSGFLASATTANTLTWTGGFQGQGVGQIVRDMELDNTNNFNRIEWPLSEDKRRATNGGFYNLVVIEYSNSHTGDLLQNYNAPKTLVLAFAAAETLETTAMDAISETAIASKKQNDFITALASLVESAGVTFVLA